MLRVNAYTSAPSAFALEVLISTSYDCNAAEFYKPHDGEMSQPADAYDTDFLSRPTAVPHKRRICCQASTKHRRCNFGRKLLRDGEDEAFMDTNGRGEPARCLRSRKIHDLSVVVRAIVRGK